MKGQNTLLFYFTATGNSLYVAKQLENDSSLNQFCLDADQGRHEVSE